MTTVLVLDDDQVILDLVQTVLTDAGYDTLVAQALQQVTPDAKPDVVITDLIPLKGYRRDSALEWVASLRARFGGLPLVVVTAHGPAVAELDRLGADAIIAKPFEVEALLATLEDLSG